MTHKPTGKIYIGSLKHDDRWGKYLTSSNTVKPMLKANPEEWHREILLKDFSPITTWSDVVALEQSIIEATSKTIGWKGMWNKGVWKGQVKGAGITPWNKGIPRTEPISDITKARMSAAHTGVQCPRSKEHQAKLNAANKIAQLGKKNSPETIAKRVATYKATIQRKKATLLEVD